MTARGCWFAVAALFAGFTGLTGFTGGGAGAADPEPMLVVAPAAVHVGEPIQVSGEFCGTGHSVATVQTWRVDPNVMVAPVEESVDLASLAIAQTPTGFSFHFVPEVAETGVSLRVTCDDGTAAGSPEAWVWVLGSFGDFFFRAPNGVVGGAPGMSTTVTARTIDCVEGSQVEASLLLGRMPPVVVTSSATVSEELVRLSLAVPDSTPEGAYELTLTCPSVRGGTVADTRPFTVGASRGLIPATGSANGVLLRLASAFVAAGLLAMVAARRRSGHAAA